MVVMKEFVSITMVAIEVGKIHIFGYHINGCLKQKDFT